MKLVALLAALVLTTTAQAEPASGRYGSLSVVVRDGTVAGSFSEGRVGNGDEAAPQFSCMFLFEGRLAGETAQIQSWTPGEAERIPGTLTWDGTKLALQLTASQPGCDMTSGDMVRQPYELMFDTPVANWIGLGFVTAKKAVLQEGPKADPERTKPYLVMFDNVAVLEQQGSWLRVEYQGETGKPVTGWLPASDLESALPGR